MDHKRKTIDSKLLHYYQTMSAFLINNLNKLSYPLITLNKRLLNLRCNTQNVSYTSNPTGEKRTLYQPLLIKPIFSLLANAGFVSKLVFHVHPKTNQSVKNILKVVCTIRRLKIYGFFQVLMKNVCFSRNPRP